MVLRARALSLVLATARLKPPPAPALLLLLKGLVLRLQLLMVPALVRCLPPDKGQAAPWSALKGSM